ncbi:hypothetical protein EYF80_002456 [Liparis tanakae]|uniref:Uncharacterized protein n=1 Tax=Liparis tanakae TaxID=230148 RepID=A0A4Z2JBP4_9TELE|nr:hypothetical protein EYF80_002456 [Liparis tanakae]
MPGISEIKGGSEARSEQTVTCGKSKPCLRDADEQRGGGGLNDATTSAFIRSLMSLPTAAALVKQRLFGLLCPTPNVSYICVCQPEEVQRLQSGGCRAAAERRQSGSSSDLAQASCSLSVTFYLH